MGWLQLVFGLYNMALSSSIKKQMMATHKGATKLVGPNLSFDNKKIKHKPK
jgi:hypothetical protein